MSLLAEAYRALRRPLLIAHRGLARLASENSLEAIEAAHAAGAHGVEIDVRPTADATLVLMHDPSLARTTGGDRRLVAELSVDALASLRLSGGERIPTLAEAVALCADRDLFLNVELKHDVPSRFEASRALARALGGKAAPAMVVSSFDPAMLAAFRYFAPEVPIALLLEPDHEFLRHLARPLGARAIHPARALVNARDVARWHEADLRVMPWTVNDPDEAAELLALGVDGLISDDPARLRPLF